MRTAIEKALKTWYPPDNPKHKDVEHPTLKMAGEIGELLDLYAKDKFKPGFNWWQCKNCHQLKNDHTEHCKMYIPLVIDELGDCWYYLRILMWLTSVHSPSPRAIINNKSVKSNIISMYKTASFLFESDSNLTVNVIELYHLFCSLVNSLGYTIDDITKSNYQKLNSEPTNHGWRNAK